MPRAKMALNVPKEKGVWALGQCRLGSFTIPLVDNQVFSGDTGSGRGRWLTRDHSRHHPVSPGAAKQTEGLERVGHTGVPSPHQLCT
jgi:hypothetical protein